MTSSNEEVHNLHFFDHEKIETKSGKRRNDAGCCGCTFFVCVSVAFFLHKETPKKVVNLKQKYKTASSSAYPFIVVMTVC